MSADNWTICPQCRDRAEAEHQAKVDAAAAAYGEVGITEYERLRAEALAEPPELAETFREDYEFWGATDGTIKAKYGGGCDVCGLSVVLECEKSFYEPTTVAT